MFDIGFTELLLISMVALLVLGPDKLPHAVRTAALWIGRARRSFNKVKGEIEQQLNTDEIRRQLHNESILSDLEDAKKKAGELTRETRESINSLKDDLDDIGDIGGGVTRKGNEPKKDGTAEQKTLEQKRSDKTAPKSSNETASEKETVVSDRESDHEGGDDNTEKTADAQKDAPPKRNKPAPVEDFYNNPSERVVTIKQGTMSVPPKPENKPADTSEKDSTDDNRQ